MPGSLHILTNLPKNLESKLNGWQTHMETLRQIRPLLCEPYHRERLRATCLQGFPDEDKLFEHFSGSLCDKRWLEVYRFVEKAHPLIKILTVRWSVHKYVSGFSATKADEDKDGIFRPHEVGVILQDAMFHSYNYLLMAIGLILRRLSSWLESCPCHAKFVRDVGTWRKQPVQWRQVFPEMSHPACPVAGCRAPELAAGGVQEMLVLVSGFCHADLARKVTELSDADRTFIFQEFGLAKSFLLLGLQVKFDCWNHLPWLLAGLGHWRAEARKSTARKAIEQFDASIARGLPVELHHPKAVSMLHVAAMRKHVEACAVDGTVAAPLKLEASKLKFMPCAERAPPLRNQNAITQLVAYFKRCLIHFGIAVQMSVQRGCLVSVWSVVCLRFAQVRLSSRTPSST